jgi:hypothetical protein
MVRTGEKVADKGRVKYDYAEVKREALTGGMN